jgi:hypothetical protein
MLGAFARGWHWLMVRLGRREAVSWKTFAWSSEIDRLRAIANRRPLTYRERRRLKLLRGDDDRAVEIDGAFVAKLERLSADDRRIVMRLVDALIIAQDL